MFNRKRAMSPLIATVFLLAFAVALGVMIMNWTPSEDTHSDEDNACGTLNMEFLSIPCLSGNELKFEIRNLGLNKIAYVAVKSNYGGNELSIKVKDSSMISTEQITASIPFSYSGGDVEVRFVPACLKDDEFFECTSFDLTIQELPTCS